METKSARLTPAKIKSYSIRLEGPIKTLNFEPHVTLPPWAENETLIDLCRSDAHRACQEGVSKAAEAEQHIKSLQQRQIIMQWCIEDPDAFEIDQRERAREEVALLNHDIARARVRHTELAEVAEQKRRAYEELCGVLEELQRDAEIDELAQAEERQ